MVLGTLKMQTSCCITLAKRCQFEISGGGTLLFIRALRGWWRCLMNEGIRGSLCPILIDNDLSFNYKIKLQYHKHDGVKYRDFRGVGQVVYLEMNRKNVVTQLPLQRKIYLPPNVVWMEPKFAYKYLSWNGPVTTHHYRLLGLERSRTLISWPSEVHYYRLWDETVRVPSRAIFFLRFKPSWYGQRTLLEETNPRFWCDQAFYRE